MDVAIYPITPALRMFHIASHTKMLIIVRSRLLRVYHCGKDNPNHLKKEGKANNTPFITMPRLIPTHAKIQRKVIKTGLVPDGLVLETFFTTLFGFLNEVVFFFFMSLPQQAHQL